MKLYDFELSGHAHRARLFASLLGLNIERIAMDLGNKAHKQPDYLAINPFGQVPALVDGDVVIADSNAILVYLATRYDAKRTWLPTDAVQAAQVQMWLSKAANEQANGVAAARLVTVFNAGLDHEAVKQKAHALLALMNAHLDGRQWFVGNAPTLADVALYSYTAHAPEGGVDVRPYPQVSAWLQRFASLPGFIAMQSTDTAAKRDLVA